MSCHCSMGKCVSVPLTPEYTLESKLPGVSRGRPLFRNLFKKIHPETGKVKASPLVLRLRKSPAVGDFTSFEVGERGGKGELIKEIKSEELIKEEKSEKREIKEEIKGTEAKETKEETPKKTRSDLAQMRLQFFGMESKSQIPKLTNQFIANPVKKSSSSRIPVFSGNQFNKAIENNNAKNIAAKSISVVRKPIIPTPFYTKFLYKPELVKEDLVIPTQLEKKSIPSSISSSSSSVYLIDDEISDHCFLVGDNTSPQFEFVEPTKEELHAKLSSHLLEEISSLRESLILLKEMLKAQEEREKKKDALIAFLSNK